MKQIDFAERRDLALTKEIMDLAGRGGYDEADGLMACVHVASALLAEVHPKVPLETYLDMIREHYTASLEVVNG